jgi:hypothetical protein
VSVTVTIAQCVSTDNKRRVTIAGGIVGSDEFELERCDSNSLDLI